jgi:hypothetical protein
MQHNGYDEPEQRAMVRLANLRVDTEIWNFTFKPTKYIKPLRSLSEKILLQQRAAV